MKEIKQKPAGGKPKTADAARVPKAVVNAAWLQAREAARAGEKQVVGGQDGAYSAAADTWGIGAVKLVSTGERVAELAYRGGRKLAERAAGRRRERAKAAQTGGEAAQRHGAGETIAHTSTIEASRPPQTREAGRVSDENRPAGARPQQRESRAVGRAKPIKPGREMKQGAPGPQTTEPAGKARQAAQAAARNGQAQIPCHKLHGERRTDEGAGAKGRTGIELCPFQLFPALLHAELGRGGLLLFAFLPEL